MHNICTVLKYFIVVYMLLCILLATSGSQEAPKVDKTTRVPKMTSQTTQSTPYEAHIQDVGFEKTADHFLFDFGTTVGHPDLPQTKKSMFFVQK